MSADCLFCKIIEGVIPAQEVYSDDEFVAFRDIHPAAPVHFLVVPRKHIPSVTAANPEDAQVLGKLFLAAKTAAAKEGLLESGYRCVVNNGPDAGQEVPHIHMHVLGGRPLSWPPG
jgi:histidine triad (HIT) family protein